MSKLKCIFYFLRKVFHTVTLLPKKGECDLIFDILNRLNLFLQLLRTNEID